MQKMHDPIRSNAMFRLFFILLASALLFAAGEVGSAAARSSHQGCGDARLDLSTGDCVSHVAKVKIKTVKKKHT